MDRRGIQQQRLALEADLAHRQAEALVDQPLRQSGVVEQIRQRFAGRLAAMEFDQTRVGQQYLATPIHRQHRIAHRGEQRIELQAPTLAGQDVHQLHRLHALHPQQGIVEFVEHRLAKGRRVDVDVRRDHLHRVEVEVARPKQRQDFLGDADTIGESDVDTHDGPFSCFLQGK
ncbi:hypothetical protein D3C81_1676650 [compost metagenome]